MRTLKPQRTLVEQVYESILDAICDGTLEPNARVRQDDIAARLAVSRQPVLTALAMLKRQGFLIEHGRRGLAVAPVDRARFDAIYELRAAIEPLAASLAAQRATPGMLARGRALVERGRRVAAEGDAKATLRADVDFHTFIYEASGNPLILESMQLHWQHLRRSMGEVLRRPSLVQRIWREHAAILEAIGKGDAATAAALIREHVAVAHERVAREIDAIGATASGPETARAA